MVNVCEIPMATVAVVVLALHGSRKSSVCIDLNTFVLDVETAQWKIICDMLQLGRLLTTTVQQHIDSSDWIIDLGTASPAGVGPQI